MSSPHRPSQSPCSPCRSPWFVAACGSDDDGAAVRSDTTSATGSGSGSASGSASGTGLSLEDTATATTDDPEVLESDGAVQDLRGGTRSTS